MSTTLKELNQKRTELYGQIKKHADEFNANGKKWKDGEQAKTWDKINADYDAVMSQMEEAQQASTIEARMAALDKLQRDPVNPFNIGFDDATPGVVGGRRVAGFDSPPDRNQIENMRNLALEGWFRNQMGVPLAKAHMQAAKALKFPVRARTLNLNLPPLHELNALRAAWHQHQRTHRDSMPFVYNAPLTTHTGSSGGNVIASETLLTSLEVNMLAYGAVRSVAEMITTGHGEPMSWPTFDDTSNEGRQIAESQPADDNAGTGASGDGGPNPTFGKITWNAFKFTSDALLVPYELLEDASMQLVPILGAALGERISRITNRRYTTGTGAGQPQGIVTAASLGVTTASGTAITGDEIIDLEHSVDAAYRNGASYMLHDTTLAHLRKLKGTDGHYLWQAGFNTGTPDTLNNRPFSVNNHMTAIPGVASAGNDCVLFGQMSKYKIRRVNQIRIYRLEERYREQDKDGFVIFVREDGGLLNAGTMPVKKLRMKAT